MKNLYLMIWIVCSPFFSYAQFDVKASKGILNELDQQKLSEKLTEYTLLEIKPNELKSYLKQNRKDAKISLPNVKGTLLNITLEEYDIRAVNYKSYKTSSNVRTEESASECPTYRGYINDNPSDYVRLMVTENAIQGMLFNKSLGYLYLEPLTTFTKTSHPNQYILYNLGDVKNFNGNCATDILKSAIKKAEQTPEKSAGARVPTACRIIELATEADFEYTQNFGNNPNANILGIINTVDGVYQNDLNIRIAVVFQNFYTTNTDPYNAGGIGGLLDEFTNHWNNNFQGVRRDLTHLFTGRNFGADLGIAWFRTACSNPGLSYGVTVQDNFSFYTAAHEIGHNIGADHATGGDCAPTRTVMCQGTNIPNVTFANFSRNEINNYLANNDGCLRNYDNLQINGPLSLCSPGTTYSTNVPANIGVNWTTSPNVTLNTNAGGIVSASPNGNGDGWIEVSFNAGCLVTHRINIAVGPPQFNGFLVNSQPYQNTNFCLGNSQFIEVLPFSLTSANTYNWFLNFGNPSNANLSPSNGNAIFNAYAADCYGIALDITNGCGTTQTGLTLCAQDCFSAYTVYPNPAKEYVTIEFTKVEKADALPDEINLLSEKSTTPVKTVNVQETFNRKTFKNGNTIEIDVKDMPRGIYYLHIKNSRRKDKELDVVRIVLE